ncbi:Integrase core domain containing protein [Dirofilaria immitis]|nr:Integrase core domain containing protein [Dirofilaria immitis]
MGLEVGEYHDPPPTKEEVPNGTKESLERGRLDPRHGRRLFPFLLSNLFIFALSNRLFIRYKPEHGIKIAQEPLNVFVANQITTVRFVAFREQRHRKKVLKVEKSSYEKPKIVAITKVGNDPEIKTYVITISNKRFGFTVCSQYSSATPYSIPNTGDILSPRREVRCQVPSLPVFNQRRTELECPNPNLSLEQQGNLYTTRKQVLEDKLDRINYGLSRLKTRMINGLNLFKPSPQQKKGMKKKRLTNQLPKGKEALLTLTKHKREAEQKSELLFKEMGKVQEKLTPSNSTVNLPQLSLPMFTGDPRQRRQFWSSFNAAVHSRAIPEIQKLNYLYSCLRGNALEAVLGYDIAPENYEIIRRLLREKYGDPSTATAILYKELRSIKRDKKERVRMIEHIERVIRQLEALGEDMEQSNIEHWIEDKLPHWILDKVFEQKEKDAPWSVSKLRDFLLKRVTRCEKVKFCKTPSAHTDIKSTINKTGPKLKYSPGGSSALSMVEVTQHSSQPAVAKTPCVFCNQNHWDSECDVYPTANGRRSRLKLLKKCLICFKDSHFSESLVNSDVKNVHENLRTLPKTDCPAFLSNSSNTARASVANGTLLLSPTASEGFSTIRFRIATILHFSETSATVGINRTDKQIIKITAFGVKNPTPYPTVSTHLCVQTVDNDVVTLAVNAVDHITNELQVQEQELHTGHMLVQTRVGPIIAGTGDISKLCKNNISPQNLVCTVRANINSELENFWRLEAIGIQGSPNDNDDEKILERFQRTLIRKKGRLSCLLALERFYPKAQRQLWLVHGSLEEPNHKITTQLAPSSVSQYNNRTITNGMMKSGSYITSGTKNLCRVFIGCELTSRGPNVTSVGDNNNIDDDHSWFISSQKWEWLILAPKTYRIWRKHCSKIKREISVGKTVTNKLGLVVERPWNEMEVTGEKWGSLDVLLGIETIAQLAISNSIKAKEWDWIVTDTEIGTKSITRDKEGKCIASWPWKGNDVVPAKGYSLAVGLLKSTIRKCRKAIINPQKTTTKLRVIFDASAKTTEAPSLNECLCNRSVKLPSLVEIILGARQTHYVIMANVESCGWKIFGRKLYQKHCYRFKKVPVLQIGPVYKNKEKLCLSFRCCL